MVRENTCSKKYIKGLAEKESALDYLYGLRVLQEYIDDLRRRENEVLPLVLDGVDGELMMYEASDGVLRLRVVNGARTLHFDLCGNDLMVFLKALLGYVRKFLDQDVDRKVKQLRRLYERFDSGLEKVLEKQVGDEIVLARELDDLAKLVDKINSIHSEVEDLIELIAAIDELLELMG